MDRVIIARFSFEQLWPVEPINRSHTVFTGGVFFVGEISPGLRMTQSGELFTWLF
jgi:hypothetical protein